MKEALGSSTREGAGGRDDAIERRPDRDSSTSRATWESPTPGWSQPRWRPALGSKHFKQELDEQGHILKSMNRMVGDPRTGSRESDLKENAQCH